MLDSILQQGMFQVDPNATPEDLERRRDRVRRMFANGGQSQSVGEGAIKLAGGIFEGLRNRNARKFEGEKRDEAASLFEQIMGASAARSPEMAPTSTPLGAPIPPVETGPIPDTPEAVGADTRAALGLESAMPASLIQTESGGNFGALNDEVGHGGVAGHGGRGQFGHARLQDAASAGIIPAGTTPQEFAQMSPEQQIAVENWHFADIDKAIDDTGAIGQNIGGVQVTRDGLRAVAHLGGVGGMRRYIASGGEYNPSDSFGTSLADYAQTHSQSGGQAPQTPQVAPNNMQDLMAAMANPWMTPDQKAMIGSMIAQQQQANDPLRQLQIQQAQLQVDQMRNPQPETTDDIREYEFAKAQGYEGSLTDFMQSNRRAGATQVNLGPQGQEYSTPVTPGQEALDKAFASEYVEWTGGGGADSLAQLDKIEGVLAQLESGETNLTGPGVGNTPDFLGTIISPDAVNARETVEEVVQRNLRVLLGAQFTAKEGEQLIARAYNPRLPEEQNAQRLRRLMATMRTAHEDKKSQVEYFEQNGTLTGWTGRQWSLSDFESAIDDAPANMNDAASEPDADGWVTLPNGVRVREVN